MSDEPPDANDAISSKGFPPLQTLRIPAGWKVIWNALFEPNQEARFQDFENEDIFQAVAGKFTVALSWSPCGDPNGRYVLDVVGERLNEQDDPWSHPLHRFETRDRDQAIAELERVLANGPYQ